MVTAAEVRKGIIKRTTDGYIYRNVHAGNDINDVCLFALNEKSHDMGTLDRLAWQFIAK